PPADFLAGHTYAVVVTGWKDAGVRDADGNPFKSDGSFLVFAEPDLFPETGTTYIGPDGSSRNSVLVGLAAAQSAEGARQLTNVVLEAWEALPGVTGAWQRNEVVAAFAFTTATNPMPDYFDPVMAFLGMPAVRPQPADAVDGQGRLVKADAGCDATLSFTLDKPIDTTTATNGTVKLFRVDGATYTEVPLTVAATSGTGATVTATPKAALAGNAQYVAAVTSGIRSADGLRAATDQTYFGLTRAAMKSVDAQTGAWTFVDTPLVAPDGEGNLVWQSSYLDSRLDTLILNGAQDAIDEESLAAAGATVVGILSYLEAMRGLYKPHMDWLVLGDDGKPGIPGAEGTDNVVAEREDLVLVWTFTTAACGQ
ncbi:MAG TPA: Ig-like domain-containing protein, partial [Myxococcota bacterium]|nr:Ig-like domain-containing protein [Myxococcota bacterium]